jgi:Ice-binding-like
MKSFMKERVMPSRAPRGRIARVIVALAFAGLFTTACRGTTDPGVLSTLTVAPNPATLAVNGTQQFTATGTDFTGASVMPNPGTVVWSVVSGGGSINATTGLFTAGTATGTFTNTVMATCHGISATATVIVTAGPVATITVTPNPGTLPINTTLQYTAVGKDAFNNVITPFTPVWSVVNGGGSINATGLFSAGSVAGTFTNTVKATSGAISGTATAIVTAGALATITVTPNPDSLPPNAQQQFTAVGRDAGGNVVPITPVWTVTNGGGTIVAGSGLFTAGAATGTFTNTVRATSGTIFGTATVIVSATAPVPIVNLGSAAPFGILAGTTVTCVTGGVVNADIGISPGNALTGFGPCTLTGTKHLADPTAATAQNDLTTAYNTLAGLPCPGANVIVADIGGTTKAAGVYCSASSIGVTGNLTLDGGGDPNATFVFQAGSTLTTAGNVILINGAQAKNVYFQVGSSATLGVGSAWQGNVIALSSITLNDNVTLTGRALARNGAVTLGNNNVITLP